MTSRRTFLGTVVGGVASVSALRGMAEAAGSKKPPIGLQLWSLGQRLAADLPGTLATVKEWGIDEIESAGFFGKTAAEFAAALGDTGLRCQAMHVQVGLPELEKELAGLLRDADTVGATTLVHPYLPHQARPHATRDEIVTAAGTFARIGKQCKAAGKRFAYHIHGQEFGPAPEGTLFDVLVSESGPEVSFELDVFWTVWGGADPVALLKRYPGRFVYTHLKDMAKDTIPGKDGQDRRAANVVLGTGQIDVRGIVAAGAKAGVEVHYIEDESGDPFGHIPRSVAYYKSL